MQRNWIGKSDGAEIKFKISKTTNSLNIYTTRPDTIYGATFIALSINHPIISSYLDKDQILNIKNKFDAKKENVKEKIGIPLNAHCRSPIC